MAPAIVKNNYEPGFFIKHFIKDMAISLEYTKEMGFEIPGMERALSLYRQVAADGYENEGMQALFRAYDK